MPHAAKGFIDMLHDLWWRCLLSKFEQLLPDVAGIAMDDRLGDPA